MVRFITKMYDATGRITVSKNAIKRVYNAE